MKKVLGVRQLQLIDSLVDHFVSKRHLFEVLLKSVEASIANSYTLRPSVHSIKSRIKDPEHLKDKLIRKFLEAQQKNRAFTITSKNLFSKITDLIGFRIIHLHTTQFQNIDIELKKIFNEQAWVLQEGPSARTWDDESRNYFRSIGIAVNKSPNMYTSVHYIIKANSSLPLTCEIQVRTLMEEVWGEVDHTINYPHKTESLPCREQIKALARATSSCSRLVDSIFSSHQDYQQGLTKNETPVKRITSKKTSTKKRTSLRKAPKKKK